MRVGGARTWVKGAMGAWTDGKNDHENGAKNLQTGVILTSWVINWGGENPANRKGKKRSAKPEKVPETQKLCGTPYLPELNWKEN